jgi:hypothetical protein
MLVTVTNSISHVNPNRQPLPPTNSAPSPVAEPEPNSPYMLMLVKSRLTVFTPGGSPTDVGFDGITFELQRIGNDKYLIADQPTFACGVDDGFPILAGSVGPSHGYVHVVEIGVPVNIQGMRVAENELIHADRHGALVIPHEVIPHLKSAIENVIESEAIVLGPAREPGFDIHRLEEVWAEFEAART